MKIRRHSARFYAALTAILTSLAGMLAAGLSSHVTYQDCVRLGLPVLRIDTVAGKSVTSKDRYVSAAYEVEGISGACKIRGHGNTTWVTRELYKKPYLLKLDKAAPLLGMAAASKWILMANTTDKTSLRNWYAAYLGTEVWDRQGWVPRSRFITLFMNGRYEGLYALTEKIEILPGRVEVPAESGGTLYEVNNRANRTWNFTTARGVRISLRGPEAITGGEFQARQLPIQVAEEALFSDECTDPEAGWRRFLDEDSFIDWYLLNEFTKNHDARFDTSCWLYYDTADGRLHMGPPWDFDISCGNISWDTDTVDGWWVRQAPWYARLFEDPAFAEKVCLRWSETRPALAASLARLRLQADSMAGAVALNDAVWHTIGRRQWPHAPGWRQRRTYQDEVDYLVDWLERRIAWMDGAFAG